MEGEGKALLAFSVSLSFALFAEERSKGKIIAPTLSPTATRTQRSNFRLPLSLFLSLSLYYSASYFYIIKEKVANFLSLY